jgi:hypothetical protein
MMFDELPVIQNLEYLPNQQLKVVYSDNSIRIVDCKPRYTWFVYTRFLDDTYFQQARINKANNTILRDNDLDMDGYGIFLSSWSKVPHGTNQ